jgi:hypothetical protein
MIRQLSATLLSAAILFVGSPALAQTCFGVETRVNAATGVLTGTVTGEITTTEATLIAAELLQRARLLSAIKVMTAQQSASTDQTVTMGVKTAEANASALTAQRVRQAVAEAKHRYGSIGYDPCGAVTKSASLSSAVTAAATQAKTTRESVRARPGAYGDPTPWFQAARDGSVADGGALYSGDQEAAKKYIDFVVGPPDVDIVSIRGTAEGDAAKLAKTGRDAYRSLTAAVLSDVAADYATDGPMAKARELSRHWIGDDGGKAWSAGIAKDHERGILQDAIRIEAANLSFEAMEAKRGMRTELSAAAVLLARINQQIRSVPVGSGGMRTRAGYQP